MKKNETHLLIGKTQREIVDLIDKHALHENVIYHEPDFYHSNIWEYRIGRKWIFFNKYLIIYFNNDNIVEHAEIVTSIF